MARGPGSLHGREPGPFSRVGYTSLSWRTGTGNWIPEPNFATETEVVDFAESWQPNEGVVDQEPDADGTLVSWDDLTMLDTRAMPWHDGRKRLADGIVLEYVAPGTKWSAAADENAYVVEGELRGPERPAAAGFFLDGGGDGVGGDSGCVVLRWRDVAAR
jgi:hypothetical protein